MIRKLALAGIIMLLTGCVKVNTPTESRPSDESTKTEVQNAKISNLYPVKEGRSGKWGYIDAQGKVIIEPQYLEAERFQSNGLATVKINTAYGAIDKTGQIVVKPEYDALFPYSEGYAVGYIDKNDEQICHVIDESGKGKLSQYNLVPPFKDGYIRTRSYEDGKEGLVNLKGEVVIESVNDKLFQFIDGKALILQTNTAHLIDERGAIIEKLGDITARPNDESTMYIYSIVENGVEKFGLMESDGSRVTEAKWIKIEDKLVDGLFRGSLDGKVQYINSKGEVVETLNNTSEYLGCGIYLSAVKDQKTYKMVDKAGAMLLDGTFTDVSWAGEKLLSVYDGKDTFLVEVFNKPKKTNVKYEGRVRFEKVEDLIAVRDIDLNDVVRYCKMDGETIWDLDRSIYLKDNIAIEEKTMLSESFTQLSVPQIQNMKNAEAQEKINTQLADRFKSNETGKQGIIHYQKYEATQKGHLLEILKIRKAVSTDFYHDLSKDCECGSEPIYWHEDVYYFDLDTGSEYTISNLFKQDAASKKKLNDRLAKIYVEGMPKGDHQYRLESDKCIIDYNVHISWEDLEEILVPESPVLEKLRME